MPTLEARGVELAWNEAGEGEPVLLIHETAASGAVWEPVAREVSKGARAVTYDRRGWGGSTAPEGYQRTTVEEQSEDAIVLIESFGGPAVLCGAGAGAIIALDLLLRRPELVVASVLVEPPILQLLPTATEALSDDRLRLESAAADGRDVVDLYLSGGLPALGPGVARLPEEVTTEARRRPASVIAELGMASAWRMPLPRLAHAQRPSAIVTAPSTPPLVREASDALAGRLASSAMREVDSGSGSPYLEDPAALGSMLLELSR